MEFIGVKEEKGQCFVRMLKNEEVRKEDFLFIFHVSPQEIENCASLLEKYKEDIVKVKEVSGDKVFSLGIGIARGEKKGETAAKQAIHSLQSIRKDVEKSNTVVINFVSGEKLRMMEMKSVMDVVKNFFSESCQQFSVSFYDDLKDEIRIFLMVPEEG